MNPPVAHTDLELASAVNQRDRKATADLVAAHADAIFSFVRRRLFPRTERIEDIVQDVFLSALEGLPGYRGDSALRSWLMGIARHKVQDYYRAQVLEIAIDEAALNQPDESAGFDGWMREDALALRVQTILAALPEGYRCVLLWRYWEKCTAAEMAARTGRSEKAIERMLARARDDFRGRWYGE